MPKRHGRLFERIVAFDSLYEAYLKARRNKRYRPEVLAFSEKLEENLIQIQNELIWGRYRTGRYRTFYVHEPKTRLVAALPFKDRLVHHAIVAVIEPLFERQFIGDSYACRPGKGMHAGADRVQQWLRQCRHNWGAVYCLKADVKKYFPSINHNALKRILRRTIKDKHVLALLDEIIESTQETGEANPAGIPIGNLTSQLFANLYLNELDQFVKHRLKVRHYIRYMDDFLLLSDSKQQLWVWLRDIKDFLRTSLALELNNKTAIFPVASRGIDFLGYRIWPDYRLLRKSSVKRMRRKIKAYKRRYAAGEMSAEEINRSIQSWLGHAQHADSYRIRTKLMGELVLQRGGSPCTRCDSSTRKGSSSPR